MQRFYPSFARVARPSDFPFAPTVPSLPALAVAMPMLPLGIMRRVWFARSFPALFAFWLASVAHAQGTMDFSGAQMLMGTAIPQL